MTYVMYHYVISGSCLRNRGYVSNRDVFWICLLIFYFSLLKYTYLYNYRSHISLQVAKLAKSAGVQILIFHTVCPPHTHTHTHSLSPSLSFFLSLSLSLS